MTRFTSLTGRLAAGAAAASAATVVAAGLAAPAFAAPLGTLALSPTSGTVDANPMFTSATTSAACPAGYGTNAALKVGRPGGPYNNLRPISSAGAYDAAPFTLNPNRSFATAIAATPGEVDWLVVVECSGQTTGTHPDRFETTITVTGGTWAVKTAAEPEATTTALTVQPAGPVAAGTSVTLTAAVSPTAAAGTVEFRDGAAALGSAAVASGAASFTTAALAVGSHQLSAAFTPGDETAYQASTSAVVTLKVTAAPGGPHGDQEITAEVVGGGLTLSLAGSAVTLDGGVLGGTATGALNQATVSDDRGDDAGWDLVGQVEAFTGTPSGTIAADQLGWDPSAQKVSGSGTVTAGASAAPGSGLGQARALCTSASGSSAGKFTCDAALNLGIPTDAAPGTYTATLTLTLS